MFFFHKEVYFDNNATTKVSKKVRKKMQYILKNYYGNPSSLYKIARESASILEESRKIVAKTINAYPDEIFFTGSASEANNNVLKSLTDIYYPGKKKIISTPIEHPSVMQSLEYLETKKVKVEYVPVDNTGRVEIDKLKKMIDGDTFLICCMFANNEIGTIQDIKKITQISKQHNTLVMSDCVQALGKIKIDVKSLDIDFATFSAHKVHGPKGIGAVFVKRDSPFQPFIHGGHQEAMMRAGTESVHNIAGFAEACGAIPEILAKTNKITAIKKTLINELQKIKPDIVINSPDDNCLPNTVNITFPGVNNAVLMSVLDLYGIAVSAGSACSTSETKPSHVLKAIGLSDNDADESIRISFSEETSSKEISYSIKVLKEFFEGKTPSIRILKPSQLDKDFIFDEKNYLIDIRFWHERKMLKSLPNSYEASFIGFNKYIHHIPKNKNIIVICMGGIDAVVAAYSLKSKGLKNVSFMISGLFGWRLAHPELYKKHAGQNITKLKPRGKG